MFKGAEALPPLHLHRQSAFLFGRDRKVADVPTDHPSCSKQHAVLQFRFIAAADPLGMGGPAKGAVKPYIIVGARAPPPRLHAHCNGGATSRRT